MLTFFLQMVAVFLSLLLLFLLFWWFWFLRDPERIIPKGNNIVSPADGKINKIIKSDEEDLTIDKGIMGKIDTLAKEVSKDYYLINIVMTPFDVHIQRSPIKGEIIKTKHVRGKFKNAMQKGMCIENERNEILISGERKIKVLQIAGVLARRIECFVKKNQKVNKGERIGLINLGSQVSLIVPGDAKLSVATGQRLKAGETIIGKF